MRSALPSSLIALTLALTLASALGACSSAVRFDADPPGSHTVRRGDTLHSIAFRNELDWRELARWNGIATPYTIAVGQQLKLTPPSAMRTPPARQGPAPRPGKQATAPTRPAPLPPPTHRPAWSWPTGGTLVARFQPGSATARGIDLGGARGDEVRAAADGKVVYVGSGLVGYGKVIIVKHDDRYLSAYAHNDRFLVEEGATVKRGQQIAAMGLGPGQRALLHFEIRLDGRAIDPLLLLPKR